MILDHIGFNVTDFEASKAFLVRSLAPLGIGIAGEGQGWAMLGRGRKGQFWFGSMGAVPGPIHVAFAAENREQVRQFQAAAIAAGGKTTAPRAFGRTTTRTTTGPSSLARSQLRGRLPCT